jgi:flagellar motor switch protein FliG
MTLALDAPPIDRRRKAAIIVRFLLADGLRPPLASLPEESQVDLTREMAQLSVVDRVTLDTILSEFADELEGVGLALRSGEEAALEAMTGHISPQAVARLRAEAARRRGLDPWGAVAALPLTDLARLLGRESLEVAAVTLSKLPVGRAAEVLGHLPGAQARRITMAVSRTARIAPDAVLRIGPRPGRRLLRRRARGLCRAARLEAGRHPQLHAPPPRARTCWADSRRRTPPFAAEVRRAIFTFAHLPLRLRAADVPKMLRGVDPKVLATALASARGGKPEEAEAAEYLLRSLPQRLADSIREEMASLPRIKAAAGEAAQAAVVAEVRERATAGEIELIDPDDLGEG